LAKAIDSVWRRQTIWFTACGNMRRCSNCHKRLWNLGLALDLGTKCRLERRDCRVGCIYGSDSTSRSRTDPRDSIHHRYQRLVCRLEYCRGSRCLRRSHPSSRDGLS
jgi:hypothetical protein